MTTAEREQELIKNNRMQEAQLTELNIELNTKQQRLRHLQEEKKKIAEHIVKHDEEKLVISRALQHQLDEKQTKIAKFEAYIAELENNSGKTQKNIENTFKGEIDEMNRKHDNLMQTKEQEKTQLDENIKTLNQFTDTKKGRQQEMEAWFKHYQDLKAELEMLKINGKKEMDEVAKQLDQAHIQNIEAWRAAAQTNANKNISAIENNIQLQNVRLEDEIILQQHEIEILAQFEKERKEDTQRESKDDDKRTPLEKKQEEVKEIYIRQYKQNKKIKELQTKIQLLEQSLQQIVYDFEKERELIKFENESKIRDQNEQIKSLAEAHRLRSREISNLKALCQMILDQRSDIEQFFLESLEQVKEEKRRVIEEERSKLLVGVGQKKEKIYIQLQDLDWEDRERILRLLFSKMNAGQTATDWRYEEEEEDYGQEEQEDQEKQENDGQVFNMTKL